MLPAEALQVLELDREANDEQRKIAYRRLSLKVHPDRNRDDKDATAKFQRVQAANECLQAWFAEKACGSSSRTPCQTASADIPDPAWWEKHRCLFDSWCRERQNQYRRNVEQELEVIKQIEQEHAADLLRQGSFIQWATGDRVFDHWAKQRARLQEWGDDMVAREAQQIMTLKNCWNVLEQKLRDAERRAAGGFFSEAVTLSSSALETMDLIDKLKISTFSTLRVLILVQRSGFYTRLQRHARAVQDAEKASRIAPDDEHLWGQLARAYLDHGRRAEALKAFKRAAHLAEKNGHTRRYSEMKYSAQQLQTVLDKEAKERDAAKERERRAKEVEAEVQRKADLEAARLQREQRQQRRIELAHELRNMLSSTDAVAIRDMMARAADAGVPESDLQDASSRLKALQATAYEAELRSLLDGMPAKVANQTALKTLRTACVKGQQLGCSSAILQEARLRISTMDREVGVGESKRKEMDEKRKKEMNEKLEEYKRQEAEKKEEKQRKKQHRMVEAAAAAERAKEAAARAEMERADRLKDDEAARLVEDEISRLVEAQAQRRNYAALCMQRATRGRIARRVVRRARSRQRAATLLQKHARILFAQQLVAEEMARRQWSSRREAYMWAQQNLAATAIQRVWRGVAARARMPEPLRQVRERNARQRAVELQEEALRRWQAQRAAAAATEAAAAAERERAAAAAADSSFWPALPPSPHDRPGAVPIAAGATIQAEPRAGDTTTGAGRRHRRRDRHSRCANQEPSEARVPAAEEEAPIEDRAEAHAEAPAEEASASEAAPTEGATERREGDDPPDWLLCPITQELMRDPVITTDGHAYERTAITTWLQKHNTSPATGLVLEHHTPGTLPVLYPVHALRGLVREWEDEQKSKRVAAVAQQWAGPPTPPPPAPAPLPAPPPPPTTAAPQSIVKVLTSLGYDKRAAVKAMFVLELPVQDWSQDDLRNAVAQLELGGDE